MDEPMSSLHFRGMALSFKIRDLFFPRINILLEASIEQGFHLLDFGCGTGSYTIAAAKLAGPYGRVYALDIHPLAVESVRKAAVKKAINTIETIQSDCATGLDDASVDIVLLYDTFHELIDPDSVLKELHRVLKPGGMLSFSDHHMKRDEILAKIPHNGLFKFVKKGKKTYSFIKEG